MGSPVTTLLSFRLRARVQRVQILTQNLPAICAKTHKGSGSPGQCGSLPWTCVNSSFRGDSLRLRSELCVEGLPGRDDGASFCFGRGDGGVPAPLRLGGAFVLQSAAQGWGRVLRGGKLGAFSRLGG